MVFFEVEVVEVCGRGVKIDGTVGVGGWVERWGRGYCCVLSSAVCP